MLEGILIMKKKIIFCIILILLLITVLFFFNQKNKKITRPINILVKTINKNNIDYLPKAFHNYCSLAILQNISHEDFNNYINSLKDHFGKNYHMSYTVINIEKLSNEIKKIYEENAYNLFNNFTNGKHITFEALYKVTVKLKIKGNGYEESDEVDFKVVKIDGKYYFLHVANQMLNQFINLF